DGRVLVERVVAEREEEPLGPGERCRGRDDPDGRCGDREMQPLHRLGRARDRALEPVEQEMPEPRVALVLEVMEELGERAAVPGEEPRLELVAPPLVPRDHWGGEREEPGDHRAGEAEVEAARSGDRSRARTAGKASLPPRGPDSHRSPRAAPVRPGGRGRRAGASPARPASGARADRSAGALARAGTLPDR